MEGPGFGTNAPIQNAFGQGNHNSPFNTSNGSNSIFGQTVQNSPADVDSNSNKQMNQFGHVFGGSPSSSTVSSSPFVNSTAFNSSPFSNSSGKATQLNPFSNPNPSGFGGSAFKSLGDLSDASASGIQHDNQSSAFGNNFNPQSSAFTNNNTGFLFNDSRPLTFSNNSNAFFKTASDGNFENSDSAFSSNNDRFKHGRNNKLQSSRGPSVSPFDESNYDKINSKSIIETIFDGNSNSIFRQRTPESKPLPPFLQKKKVTIGEKPAPLQWDLNNQKKMLEIEASQTDLQTKYETLQEMRQIERDTMEKAGRVDAQDSRKNLDDAIVFAGSCADMCPVFERVRRAYENDVKDQERNSEGKVTKELAVKAFSRPAAGQPPPLPSDVRPPDVLVKTLNYLVQNVLPLLPKGQTFLWDRTRSIRQDFTYQNDEGTDAVACNEIIARIHIVTLHVMAGSGIEYSRQQELEQLGKTIQTLVQIYADGRKRGLTFPNEPEIRAYQLILHIHDPDIEQQIQNVDPSVFLDERVQLALLVRQHAKHNTPLGRSKEDRTEFNEFFFAELFSILQTAQVPFLLASLMECHFNEIRLYALRALERSIHKKSKLAPYPVHRLTRMLAFDNAQQAKDFCGHYSLPTIVNTEGEECIELIKWNEGEVRQKPPLDQAYNKWVQSKLSGFSLQDIVMGGFYPVHDAKTTIVPAFVQKPVVISQKEPLKISPSTVAQVNEVPQKPVEPVADAKPTKLTAEAIEAMANQLLESVIEKEVQSAVRMHYRLASKEHEIDFKQEQIVEKIKQIEKEKFEELRNIQQRMLEENERKLETQNERIIAESLFERMIKSIMDENTSEFLAKTFDQERLARFAISKVRKAGKIAYTKTLEAKHLKEEEKHALESIAHNAVVGPKGLQRKFLSVSEDDVNGFMQNLADMRQRPVRMDFGKVFEDLRKRGRPKLTIAVHSSDWNGFHGQWLSAKMGFQNAGSDRWHLLRDGCMVEVAKFMPLDSNQDLWKRQYQTVAVLIFEVGTEDEADEQRSLQQVLEVLYNTSMYNIQVLLVNWKAKDAVGNGLSICNLGKLGAEAQEVAFEDCLSDMCQHITVETNGRLSAIEKEKQEKAAKLKEMQRKEEEERLHAAREKKRLERYRMLEPLIGDARGKRKRASSRDSSLLSLASPSFPLSPSPPQWDLSHSFGSTVSDQAREEAPDLPKKLLELRMMIDKVKKSRKESK